MEDKVHTADQYKYLIFHILLTVCAPSYHRLSSTCIDKKADIVWAWEESIVLVQSYILNAICNIC